MKTQSKHTPGPWHAMPFGKDSTTGYAGETIYGPDNKRIAEVLFTPPNSSLTKGRDEAEHKANVALLESAPDLLRQLDELARALRLAMPAIERDAAKLMESAKYGTGETDGAVALLDQARAALASVEKDGVEA